MSLNFNTDTPKEIIFEQIAVHLRHQGLKISGQDNNRPWGGYIVIEENQSEKFIDIYFPHLAARDFKLSEKISPKILIVAPGNRLSWQYHNRRSEIWKLIGGTAAVVLSNTDEETETQKLSIGDIVQIKQGERHRLIGLDSWGIIAELWMHTNAENPSDEEDIVRLQDDFGR